VEFWVLENFYKVNWEGSDFLQSLDKKGMGGLIVLISLDMKGMGGLIILKFNNIA
jgi:hypothetical protein